MQEDVKVTTEETGREQRRSASYSNDQRVDGSCPLQVLLGRTFNLSSPPLEVPVVAYGGHVTSSF